MTSGELAVSLLCAVVGYAIVNSLLNRGERRNGAGVRQGAWHLVLGVSPDATRDEISAAYRVLISQYHPDKVSRLGPEIRAVAERKSAEINRAYEQALALRRLFP